MQFSLYLSLTGWLLALFSSGQIQFEIPFAGYEKIESSNDHAVWTGAVGNDGDVLKSHLEETIRKQEQANFPYFPLQETLAKEPFFLPTLDCDRANDSLVLVDFFYSTDGPNWGNSWDLNDPIDSWYGVSLDENGCVVYIRIRNNGLNGHLPALALPALKYLDLNQNALQGELPDLSSLPNLEWLLLVSNQLSGTLPDLNLPQLINLGLDDNEFYGEIPNFSKLPNLEQLALTFNQLEGTLPDFINSPKLLGLYLSYNNLSGPVPSFINFPNLIFLGLRENRFTFEDILPTFEENISIITQNDGSGYNYKYLPQQAFLNDMTITALAGDMFRIDLMIDDTVTTNIYRWYKDGVFFREIYGSNQLIFDQVRTNDAGTYQCLVVNEIANPGSGALTSGEIMIEIFPDDCEASILIQFTQEIPSGTYRAKDTLRSGGSIITGNKATFTAGQSIKLVPGFQVGAGAEFNAYIEDCVLNSTEYRTASFAVGVEEEKTNELDLTLYPNPTSHSFLLEYFLSQSAPVQILLVDLYGRMVKTIQPSLMSDSGHHQLNVSVEELDSGIYQVHLMTPQEQISGRLVVIK